MIVTEYEGVDEYVDLSCDRCGYKRRWFGPTHMGAKLPRCNCPRPSRKEADTEAPQREENP